MELQLRDFMKLIRDFELVSMLETITDYRVKLSYSFLVCSSFHPSPPLSVYPFKFLTVDIRERENSQRHLEGSRLNWAMRGERWGEGGGERERRQRQRPSECH